MNSVLGIELPHEWRSAPLKYVTSNVNRGTAPDYVDEGPVRMISQAANQAAGLDWSRCRFHNFDGDARNLKGFLRSGDVLVNSTGTGTLGRIGYFGGPPDDRPCVADGHVTLVRASGDYDSRYLFYWLRSVPFSEYVYAALVVGATNQIELNREKLRETAVPVPPLEEQRRIADFLDAETSRIDRLMSSRYRQTELLQERSRAVVSELLLPGISCKPQGKWPWGWLPGLPADRPLVRLGYVCRIQNGITIDAKRDVSNDSVTLPYLRVANVQAGFVALKDIVEVTVPRQIAARSTLRPGDVLMTEGGDLDKLGRGTVWRGEIPVCLHQNHVFALRPEVDRLDGDYLALMTQTVHGRCYFESTGVKTTNLASTNSGKILSFPLPLPGVDTQRKLVDEVNRVQAESAQIQSALERQSSLLNERRQALITAAVTGQFDVSIASGRTTTQGV